MTPIDRGAAPGSENTPKKAAQPDKAIDFRWGLRIPMRDGVELNGTLYKPRSDEPAPAIFTLTPYIADSYHERATYFARRGLAFLLVDCRGRGNSAGEFVPFAADGEDGHDVVAWIAKQLWCSGAVAMWGGSYAGFNQWMTLREFPAALSTIVPAAAAHAGVDFPGFKNIFFPYEVTWQTLVSGKTPNMNLFADHDFWQEKLYELYISNQPFRTFDTIAGNPLPIFQALLDHPALDDYWQQWQLSAEDYRRIDMPILTITGHYDGDQPGALHYYQEHMRHGTAAAIENHFLIIGPWDHAGTRTPNKQFAGLTFAEASLIDLNELHREWYAWTMQEGPRPSFLQQRVAYYVAGAETWKYAGSLQAITAGQKRLYLSSINGQANDVFHSGQLLETIPQDAQPDRYIYDPLDGRPAAAQREYIEAFLTSQRYALNLFGGGLVYHSEPFTEAVEIAGFLKLVLWLAIDVPDTDFHAVLYEITANGESIQLAEDLLRARYRESLAEEKLITPGAVLRYTFDSFTFFARQIAEGSRLRLLIKSPGSIHIQKNFNGGGVVAEESAVDARTAHVTLFHDAAHPSFLELPIGRSDHAAGGDSE